MEHTGVEPVYPANLHRKSKSAFAYLHDLFPTVLPCPIISGSFLRRRPLPNCRPVNLLAAFQNFQTQWEEFLSPLGFPSVPRRTRSSAAPPLSSSYELRKRYRICPFEMPSPAEGVLMRLPSQQVFNQVPLPLGSCYSPAQSVYHLPPAGFGWNVYAHFGKPSEF